MGTNRIACYFIFFINHLFDFLCDEVFWPFSEYLLERGTATFYKFVRLKTVAACEPTHINGCHQRRLGRTSWRNGLGRRGERKPTLRGGYIICATESSQCGTCWRYQSR